MAYIFANGSGTEADPYQVWTAADLNGVRDHLSAHFIQMADIEFLTPTRITPIGSLENPFTGVYDGAHHFIANFTVNYGIARALFAVTDGATIKNLRVEDVEIYGTNYGHYAALIGLAENTTISKCVSSGSVGSYAEGDSSGGGLVAELRNSSITDSFSTCFVRGYTVGGLVGVTSASSIENCCYYMGIVYPVGDGGGYTGGLIGQAYEDYGPNSIINCFYDSEYSGMSDTGKGEPKTTTEMKQQGTYTNWDFENTWRIDPDINYGYPYLAIPYTFKYGSGTEEDPYQIWNKDDLKGIRSNMSAHYIQRANIDLTDYMWTPVRTMVGGRDVRDAYFRGSYNGNGFKITGIGNVLFYINAGTLSRIRLVDVYNVDNYYCGVAMVNFGLIERCNVSGENSKTQGFLGIANESGSYGEGIIEDCYVRGTGTASGARIGICSINRGIIRRTCLVGSVFSDDDAIEINLADSNSNYGRIENCYVIASISSPDSQMCSVAKYSPSYGNSSISNCFVVGYFEGTGDKKIGVVVDYSSSPPAITSSYFNNDEGEPGYGTGVPLEQLKEQNTFIDWDFETIWGIDPAKNDGYPYLLWQSFEEPDPPQPWTPPKLEPSWWEGFKLPFNILELDDDAPIAIQRNFKEIEHFINILGRTSGEIKDSIGQLAAAIGGEPSEYPIEWEEPDVPSTDSNFAGYLLGKEGQMGSIDASIKTDEFGGINEVWIARVIDRRGIVEIYDSDAPEHIFRTVAREFNLPIVNLGAEIVDVAIEFDGTYNQYGIFVSDAAPDLFWVERTSDEDIIYSVKWNGTGTPPEPIELARAYLGDLYGSSRDLDSSITV